MQDATARSFCTGPSRGAQTGGWVLLGFAALVLGLGMQDKEAWPIALLIGATMAASGAFFALWRWGLRVEDDGRTVTYWRGFLAPLFRSSHPRTSITGVQLDREVSVVESMTRVHYRVRVMRSGALGDLYRRRFIDGQEARREAETLAKALAADLVDGFTGSHVVRAAASLDESLVARHRRLGQAVPFPAPPDGAVAAVQRENGRVVLELPPVPARPGLVASVVGLPVLLLAVAAASWRFSSSVWAAEVLGSVALFLVLCVPFGLMLIFNLFGVLTRRETIVASPAGIDVSVAGLVERERFVIPAAEIEEVVAPTKLPHVTEGSYAFSSLFGVNHPATQVLIRTDRRDVAVGRSLPLRERTWLRNVLVHGLVGDAPSVAAPARPPPEAGRSADVVVPARKRLVVAAAVITTLAIAGAALVLGPVSLWPWQATPAPTPEVDYARYEFKPARGSGILRVYGRGGRAEVAGSDLRVTLEEILLLPVRPRDATAWYDLTVSVHRATQSGWTLVGAADRRSGSGEIAAGRAATVPGPHAFVVRGAGEVCASERCAFRLHVVGRVGSERPGWEVTDLAPVTLAARAPAN
jgi:hypothetical protein